MLTFEVWGGKGVQEFFTILATFCKSEIMWVFFFNVQRTK